MREQGLTAAERTTYCALVAPHLFDNWYLRHCGSTKIWLPDDAPWSSRDQLPDWLWNRPETEGHDLWACREMLFESVAVIWRGESPDAYAFEHEGVEFTLLERSGCYWLASMGLPTDHNGRDLLLPVIAINSVEGWALTLHGLWRFHLGCNEPEATDPEPEAGGR
jgi:hypothetical protein